MSRSKNTETPILALRKEDVGNLDSVLRGYYRRQIKSLEKRKDRKLARQLLQDHLVLPKSRQRTSKDAAYIKEILGIDFGLLDKLEDSRLIRRIQKSGTNPIYEVSHDTLVEPILSERNNREVITGFIKRTWKYILFLLLLLFLFGMFFENTFELLPEPFRKPQRVDITMDRQVIGMEEQANALIYPLPPVIVEQDLRPSDSIMIRLPITPVDLRGLRRIAGSGTGDTLSITLASPIEVPVGVDPQIDSYHSFSDVVVPIVSQTSTATKRIYARVSGDLKMTETDSYSDGGGVEDYNIRTSIPIQVELGDTLLSAASYSRSIPVNFTLQLSDLFEDELEKDKVKNVLGDRDVNLTYTVQLGSSPVTPAPPKVEVPSVRGIEVQYSDGSKRFIPNNSEDSGTEVLHVVAANETLFSIAKQYDLRDDSGNVSTQAIIELNGLQSNTISVGQVLRIPNQ